MPPSSTSRGWFPFGWRWLLILCAPLLASAHAAAAPIIVPASASALERFAARELQRYVYLRTGAVLPILPAGPAAVTGTFLLRVTPGEPGEAAGLRPGDYRLRSAGAGAAGRHVLIEGGDPVGLLYGVYRYVEHLGVRFYLHGDVVPDNPVPLVVALPGEEGRALFSVRGLLPFHDFPEGPDWWNTDDYLATLGQMAKLRMNFLGLHTYPDSQVGPEPTVWIGPPQELDEAGRLRAAYPASYHTTGRSGRTWWTFAPMRTSDFLGGAAALFERDDFGADVMRGHEFSQQTPEGSMAVFERTADMLRTAFADARRLGILTCVGTETPLTLPAALQARLRERGQPPDDPALPREIYRAMFARIQRLYPVDYYWLWTPENWTWEGNRAEAFAATARDIQAALDALNDLGNPMTLATSGWVLGPQHDRAALDHLLPSSSPMSAINSAVGHTPIERQFANLSERPRWAIPWLENDGTITAPQLWAGRMRYDAADARRLGCTGLIGIHWRTKILAPAIAALAGAAWDQSWVPADFDATPLPRLTASGATGGRVVTASGAVASSTDRPLALYQSNRVGMEAYDLLIPDGQYVVRLGFSELEDQAPGARVFDVRLHGRDVVQGLDIAAVAGARRGILRIIDDVKVTEARLRVEFTPVAGEPAIAFIEVEGTTREGQLHLFRRINCGGPLHAEYEADEWEGRARPPIDRTMPVADLYQDFATAHFGPEVAADVARILLQVEGVKLPVPNHWIDGPGDIKRNAEPWSAVSASYAFVGELEQLEAKVHGAANRDRFANWLNPFRAMRLLAEVGCLAGAMDREMAALPADDAASARAQARERVMPLRLQLAERWTALLRTTLAAASTVSELGTVANLEQRSRIHQRVLDKHDERLVAVLGEPLPPAAQPASHYAGTPRIIVPTVRTAAAPGEALTVRVLLLAPTSAGSAELRWRWLGEKEYHRVPLRHLARHVFEGQLPGLDPEHGALEYHVLARLDGTLQRWPVTERDQNQTVVLFERE